ncbi:MAG TPA: glycosyltransferase family 9 protein [Rhabdochlamydiaceae bacterium]|jgi:hypothetical protein
MPVKVAVLPAKGIGDALLMMIASHQLLLTGCEVTTFHNSFSPFGPWFPGHKFASLPPRDALIETLFAFDKIIVQNDNSPSITLLRSAFGVSSPANSQAKPKLSIFYPSYISSKHGSLSPFDQVFLPHLTMADNLERAVSHLLSQPVSKDNGITPPSSLVHRKYDKRIIIQPTSSVAERSWLPERFFSLAEKLQRKGFQPVFSVSPSERQDWFWVEKRGFSLPALPSLSSLAELIYESGFVICNESLVSHLASNLNIASLILAGNPKRMRLWQPGWLPAKLLFPPSWIPNLKFFRLRENKWQYFISVNAALRVFKSVVNILER